MSEKKRSRKRASSQKQSLKLKIEQSGRYQSSQSGLISCWKFMEGLGMRKAFAKAVKHERKSNSIYGLCEVFMLSVIGIIGGATSIKQIEDISTDGVLSKVLSWMRIPVSTTIGRIYKSLGLKDIYALEFLNHRLRGKVWRRCERKGTLSRHIKSNTKKRYIDVDSTVVTVFGKKQEGACKGYNPTHKGRSSYHPLIVFYRETKEILEASFRTGSAYTSNGIVSFCKQLFSPMPNVSMPNVKYILRADSGFFSGDLLRYLEKEGHGYLIKVKLKNLKKILGWQKWEDIPNKPGFQQCVFVHHVYSWDRGQHFIAVRQLIEERSSGRIFTYDVDENKYQYFCYV